jgi:hypothetical protein
VHGTKKAFFVRRQAEWLREMEAGAGRVGQFYTKLSKLYVLKYGYDLADNEDLAVETEDPPDAAADIVVHEVLTAEQQAFREAYMKKLRSVSGRGFYLKENTYKIISGLGHGIAQSTGHSSKATLPPSKNCSPGLSTARQRSRSTGAPSTSIRESFMRRESRRPWRSAGHLVCAAQP